MSAADYEAFVMSSPQGSIFCMPWWLDAVAGPGRWSSNELRSGDGSIVAAWPTVRRESRAGDVHVGAPMTPSLGPLLTPGDGKSRWSRQATQLEGLIDLMSPYAHLEARCSPAFTYWTPLRWAGMSQTTHYTWRIEDTTDLAVLEQGFQSRVRQSLRRAEKAELRVGQGSSEDLVAMVADTFTRQGLDDDAPSAALLTRIAEAAITHEQGEIIAARDAEGRLHSAGLFVHDGRSTWYLAGGADAELRASGAMTAVVWEGIRRASARSTAFDFEGSMLQHVESFVRGFGGEPVPYSIVRHTPSAAWERSRTWKRRARRVLRRG